MSVNDFLLAGLVFVDDSFLLVNEANLYGLVAVVLNGLDLCYNAGTSLKYGYGNQYAVVVENLSHSDFGS